jgi:hypothetical protein
MRAGGYAHAKQFKLAWLTALWRLFLATIIAALSDRSPPKSASYVLLLTPRPASPQTCTIPTLHNHAPGTAVIIVPRHNRISERAGALSFQNLQAPVVVRCHGADNWLHSQTRRAFHTPWCLARRGARFQ